MDDIEKQTGFKLSNTQRKLLIEAVSIDLHLRRLTDVEYALHRGSNWKKQKKRMIKEWQKQYNRTWPVYGAGEVESSGYKTHVEGRKFDAHEIIPNVYGGFMEWWNLVPAENGKQHQAGIHRSGAPINELYPEA